MFRFFCLYPWLLIWPWFFGIALASFQDGVMIAWIGMMLLAVGFTRGKIIVLACLLGVAFGSLCLPTRWKNLAVYPYLVRTERVTPRVEMAEILWSSQLQEWGRGRFAQVLPPREAVLAAAMLYGDAAFSSQDRIKIRAVGLAHLVAVSGANILFLLLMARFIWHRVTKRPRWRFFGDTIGIFVIVLLTGASSSVVRGGLMLVLFSGATILRRRASFGRLLLFSGLLLVVAEPRRLLFDAGYLLSFFACIGLLHASDPGKDESILEKISLKTSWFTWLWTGPFQLWFFGTISWLGLLTNALVLFVVPWIQALALLTLLWPTRVFAWPLEQCLAYLWLVIDRISPFSHPWTLLPMIAFWFMIGAYAVLLLELVHKRMGFWRPLASTCADGSWGMRSQTAIRWVCWLPVLIDECPDLLIQSGISMLSLSAKNQSTRTS